MPLPTGLIVIWHGSLGSIPPGWTLCDGTLGTPDLRNRFVLGAGDTYDPDDTGGAASHNHAFASDGHYHEIQMNGDIAEGEGYEAEAAFETDSGTTDTDNHLPPYYALAYIMLL